MGKASCLLLECSCRARSPLFVVLEEYDVIIIAHTSAHIIIIILLPYFLSLKRHTLCLILSDLVTSNSSMIEEKKQDALLYQNGDHLEKVQ